VLQLCLKGIVLPRSWKAFPICILKCQNRKPKFSPFIFPSRQFIPSCTLRRTASKSPKPIEVFRKVGLDFVETVRRTFVCKSFQLPIFLLGNTGQCCTTCKESRNGNCLVLVDAEADCGFQLLHEFSVACPSSEMSAYLSNYCKCGVLNIENMLIESCQSILGGDWLRIQERI
jgi:hypothetical protein